MAEIHSSENEFLLKITKIVEEHLSNDQFGVSELADKVGMSRSNLLRKVKKLTQLSVSQFIRQVRLKNAIELLEEGSFTVSEISYKVGFSSSSYFIKCFREDYGYPPGEHALKGLQTPESIPNSTKIRRTRMVWIAAFTGLLLIVVIGFIFFYPFATKPVERDKSIAVLPFIDDSNDSANVYIINGLMESILNNLQKVEDLRVISRTSVEKYRNHTKTIPEMAEELNVSYFVEGSGQKIGDQILLTIQLIDAKSDQHLWSEQYTRDARNIFALQMEVAKNIAQKIEAIITPEEAERIAKVPTDDLVAYDYFLQAKELMNQGNAEGLHAAIPVLNKAVVQDPEFARAYAALAMCYYYLDVFQSEKIYIDQLNQNADKALLYDAQLPRSLLAKALYYMNIREYHQALPYLEKALEYNPNSALIINTLADFYTSYMPDTEKYLEYALKGIQLDIASNDSTDASYIYLHLSNAFAQCGFVDEAEKYINQSIAYNPDNLYSAYVKAYVLYAKNKDLEQTRTMLIETLERDSSRLDIMQEIGKICFYQKDYKQSYFYYKKFIDIKENYQLDIYRHENARIGFVFWKMGLKEKSEEFYADLIEFASTDNSIYRHLHLIPLYALNGETEKAIDALKLFSQEDNYQYWILLFMKNDPMLESIKDHPEFRKAFKKIESKFWKQHREIKASLEKQGLI